MGRKCEEFQFLLLGTAAEPKVYHAKKSVCLDFQFTFLSLISLTLLYSLFYTIHYYTLYIILSGFYLLKSKYVQGFSTIAN